MGSLASQSALHAQHKTTASQAHASSSAGVAKGGKKATSAVDANKDAFRRVFEKFISSAASSTK